MSINRHHWVVVSIFLKKNEVGWQTTLLTTKPSPPTSEGAPTQASNKEQFEVEKPKANDAHNCTTPIHMDMHVGRKEKVNTKHIWHIHA